MKGTPTWLFRQMIHNTAYMLDVSVVAAILRISSLVVAYNITMSIMNDVLVCMISPLLYILNN